jgi:hypothetical protein
LPAPLAKSKDFFDGVVCQIFTFSPTEAYFPNNCTYGVASTLRPGVRTKLTVDALDFVYVLNDGTHDVVVSLYDKFDRLVQGMGTLTMPPGNWGFVTWGGSFQNNYAGARFVSGGGSIGITHHDRIPAP